ncbi:glycosyltransferase [Yoonia sediminilitoris]|uniref:Glycosyltransferase 2-like domain-containing protein n=1 Tax=Yoonia sediminilitoris TaxID=1286148 RepID=A0A2T6KLW0_9RHOB|nr:glycosyltransferase [Yoonia sediminilitoris]PUB17205.1 hypothetical protein C8N45_102215 [Yoonia sediminilitoris]RCW97500.1 hypothetical protein DFP92_102215 [Yoonia sediminilitoris]
MQHLRVSVIIPTYADWDRLAHCLSALEKQDFPVGDFEIIVANNNKKPDTPSGLVCPSNVVVIHVATPGSYAARNAAVAVSKGDILAFTDADCIPDHSWLSEGVKEFDNNPDVDLVAGGVRFIWQGSAPNIVETYDSIFNLQQQNFARKGGAATANLFVRRDVFDRFGLFDETRFSGGDIDFTKRATSGGAKLVYAEDARINHPARQNLGEVIRKARRMTGAGILQKRQEKKNIIIPHLDRLFPSFKAMKRIYKSGNATLVTGVGAWLVFYLVQIARVAEQCRLIFFKSSYERK